MDYKVKTAVATALLLVTCAPGANAQMHRRLEQIEVTARRPLRDIGATITRIDSASLHESVAQSMADVLAYNSSIFIKSYGRASLSTVSFRGTSASHTGVTWNGLPVNSPMLGMTDFSTIPSFFVDRAELLHGSASIIDGGGGLGGAVRLASGAPDPQSGLRVRYIQGVGSYSTFDEFLQVDYGGKRTTSSTRISYASSANDYHYINHDKKENIYDPEGNIIGKYNPREVNKSGAFNDFNALQDIGIVLTGRDKLTINAWVTRSRRELPLLTTDYATEGSFENVRHETTLRATASWIHRQGNLRTEMRGGYIYTHSAYDYSRALSPEVWALMTHSRSRVQTITGTASAELFSPDRHWLFSAGLDVKQHFVKSTDRDASSSTTSQTVYSGYNVGQAELSALGSVKWQPSARFGASAVLREELHRTTLAPLIPALMIDASLTRDGALTAHASASRNHRFPSLNDLYFMPGGNPHLRPEKGWSYDAGIDYRAARAGVWRLEGGVTWFDSRIDDWILWLPTVKGFFSPKNVKSVHSYGIELKGHWIWEPRPDFSATVGVNYSWTPSINTGEPMSEADRSIGRQLPYIPRHSASLTAAVEWRRWSAGYKWCFYSRRYTMSSSDVTLSGSLPAYFMSNLTLGRNIPTRVADLDIKLAVNNLLNEEYLSVLSRPMPGINFELFLTVTPRW